MIILLIEDTNKRARREDFLSINIPINNFHIFNYIPFPLGYLLFIALFLLVFTGKKIFPLLLAGYVSLMFISTFILFLNPYHKQVNNYFKTHPEYSTTQINNTNWIVNHDNKEYNCKVKNKVKESIIITCNTIVKK